jgi:hypothetical protein
MNHEFAGTVRPLSLCFFMIHDLTPSALAPA